MGKPMNRMLQLVTAWVMLAALLWLPRHGPNAPKVALTTESLSSEGGVLCDGCNPLVFGQPLNVNRATVDELMLLPRIGQNRAEEIVRMREEKAFESLADLDVVSGIGPKTLSQLAPLVSFD